MTVLQEIVVESILPIRNQIKWSWYHSFQKTMFHLMKLIKIRYIFENQSIMKIECPAFLGHPVYAIYTLLM